MVSNSQLARAVEICASRFKGKGELSTTLKDSSLLLDLHYVYSER